MAEWPIASVLKTEVPAREPWVRILHPPLMDNFMTKWFLPGAGFAMVIALCIDSYYGEEQFKWSQTTHQLILLGMLLAGVCFSLVINYFRPKEK